MVAQAMSETLHDHRGELGGYQQELFITHTPELWGMADWAIELERYRAGEPAAA